MATKTVTVTIGRNTSVNANTPHERLTDAEWADFKQDIETCMKFNWDAEQYILAEWKFGDSTSWDATFDHPEESAVYTLVIEYNDYDLMNYGQPTLNDPRFRSIIRRLDAIKAAYWQDAIALSLGDSVLV